MVGIVSWKKCKEEGKQNRCQQVGQVPIIICGTCLPSETMIHKGIRERKVQANIKALGFFITVTKLLNFHAHRVQTNPHSVLVVKVLTSMIMSGFTFIAIIILPFLGV